MVRKVKLIDDWKRAWRFASIQISTIGVVLMSLAELLGQSWSSLPPALQQRIPHATTIALLLFGLNVVGRLTKFHPHEETPHAGSSDQ